MASCVRIAISALLASTLCACAAETDTSDPESIGASEEALWAERGTKWPANHHGVTRISVCWETPGFHASKKLVRETIATSWQAVARIDFTGWHACGAEGADLRIRVADEPPHVEDFGARIRGVPNGMTLNFEYVLWRSQSGCHAFGNDRCIRTQSMHEFGHALGFLHEQDRLDAPAVCPDGRDLHTGTDPSGGLLLSAYDPESVMNYCAGAPVHLSHLDVRGARRWYGARGWDADDHHHEHHVER